MNITFFLKMNEKMCLEKYQHIYKKFFKYTIFNRLSGNIPLSLKENDCIFNIEENILGKKYSRKITKEDISLFRIEYSSNLGKLYDKIYSVSKDLTLEEFIYSYLHTIDILADKYSCELILELVKIINGVTQAICKLYSNTGIENINELSAFILIEKENFKNNDYYFYYISENIFTPKVVLNSKMESFTRFAGFIEYINYVGIEHYERYLNALCNLIINKKYVATKSTYDIFIFHELRGILLTDKEKIEKCLKIFVQKGIYSKNGLILLKLIKSPYIEKYKSFLLMKELIENE